VGAGGDPGLARTASAAGGAGNSGCDDVLERRCAMTISVTTTPDWLAAPLIVLAVLGAFMVAAILMSFLVVVARAQKSEHQVE